MKDYITAKERVETPRKKWTFLEDTIAIAAMLGIGYLFFLCAIN